MGDALLAERGWKTLAVKQRLKNDKGLGKALAAWEKLGDDGAPGERLAALAEVVAVAGKLAKDAAVEGDDKLSDYVDDVVKAAGKARKEVEAARASGDEEKDAGAGGDEAEEEVGDFATRLLGGLNRVKNG